MWQIEGIVVPDTLQTEAPLVTSGAFVLPRYSQVVVMPALDEWDPKRGRSGRPWQRLVKRHCIPGAVCAWCSEEIVFGLRPRHPLGPSLDHIIALIEGGHPTAAWNLQPMHLGCNVRKENHRRRQVKAGAQRLERPRTKLRPR